MYNEKQSHLNEQINIFSSTLSTSLLRAKIESANHMEILISHWSLYSNLTEKNNIDKMNGTLIILCN